MKVEHLIRELDDAVVIAADIAELSERFVAENYLVVPSFDFDAITEALASRHVPLRQFPGRADRAVLASSDPVPRVDVLVLDDWGMSPLRDAERKDMLEILDDRSGARATMMSSQIPPNKWHDLVGDPTTADAICDGLLHNAHGIDLKGPPRRKGKKDTDND